MPRTAAEANNQLEVWFVDLDRAFEGLATCDLSDACDKLGITAYTTGAIKPVHSACRPIIGKVTTIELSPESTESAVDGTLKSIAVSEPGAIVVIATDGQADFNTWGSINSTAAVERRLSGIISDGAVRDVQALRDLDFPAYTRGTVVASVRGRVGMASLNQPVTLDGNVINPGDIAAADENGVVVFPGEQAHEVFEAAYAVVTRERRMVQRIRYGEDPIRVHHEARYEEPKS